MNNLLYIGLNGLAGSGKDTVAKMINVILMRDWNNIKECKKFYNEYYTKPNASASYYEKFKKHDSPIICLAFADQLKRICANIFGIPLKCFYFNKSTAWVCINKGFEYTEIRPDNVVSCEEYYYNLDEYKVSEVKYWMSLRDILVYVGTYILQADLNKRVFVNTVENQIRTESLLNNVLQYAIITDIRFNHELDYIKNKNGLTIKIVRDNVVQLNNIAEHELDDEDSYDFIIYNNGTYDDLFKNIWDIIHDNIEFKNITINLGVRENISNYLRKIKNNTYKVCSPYRIQQIAHDENGNISMIDLKGGPTIDVGINISGTNLFVEKITMNDDNKFYITAKEKEQ